METPNMPSMHTFQAAPLQPHPQPIFSLPQITPFPQTPIQQTQLGDATDRARQYKSRNKRPCDFCRYKKAACHLETAPPCELCIRYNKECTFVESPAKRRRPNDSGSDSGQRRNSGTTELKHDRNGSVSSNGLYPNTGTGGTGYDMQQDLMGWDNGMAQFQMPSMGMDNGLGAPQFALDPSFYQVPGMAAFNTFEPMSTSTVSVHHDHSRSLPQVGLGGPLELAASPQSASTQAPRSLSLPADLSSGAPSLDHQSSCNSTVVGLSGETDPYLLSRYQYDQHNEANFHSIKIRRLQDATDDQDNVPTFFSIQHNALASKAQPQEQPETLRQFRREVQEMVSDDVGKRLIRLFYRYVQPYFPILSRASNYQRDEKGRREPSTIPTCLLAAVYGHALPFCAWDEKLCVDVYTPPSADALFKIAWAACMSSLHTPSYAGLQTLLLFVQRRPTNKNVSDTPFKGVMISAAVSIAISLGLNRDPSDWPLPVWEIKQRRRLAWATFIQDRWLALNSGRLGFLRSDDWDVEPLTEDDMLEMDVNSSASDATPSHHFVALCSLTLILDDISRDLYSVKATRRLHADLEATLDVVNPLRRRLAEWHQSLPLGLLSLATPASSPADPATSARRPSSQYELDGNASLHLAYITLKLALFRAALRPTIIGSPSIAASTISSVRRGALAVAREVHAFLEQLNARELEAFWASYGRTNFTMASSFIFLLFVTATDEADAADSLALLTEWRALLRVKSRSCDLLNLALLRLDGVFAGGLETKVVLSDAAAKVWLQNGKT